jgi:hypothetical protein
MLGFAALVRMADAGNPLGSSVTRAVLVAALENHPQRPRRELHQRLHPSVELGPRTCSSEHPSK